MSGAFNSEIRPGPTKDEQLVNDALLLFLRTLLVYQSELKCHWAADRSPFSKAVFGDNSMVARIQTAIWKQMAKSSLSSRLNQTFGTQTRTRKFYGKRQARWLHGSCTTINTSESANFVGKLNKTALSGAILTSLNSRLLVSQDNHEIFLTIADYDHRYLAYLKNGDTSRGPLLKMQTYGPWNIAHPTHMKDLAMIILCVAFEVTYDLASSADSQQN